MLVLTVEGLTLGTNTAWTPWQYQDGFWYRVRQTAVGDIDWEVVDSAYGSVPGGSGSIIGGTFQAGVSAAIDFIENHDDDEYFEDPEVDPIGGVWKVVTKSEAPHAVGRCYTIELKSTTKNAGIAFELFIWRVRDINNVIKYEQSYPQNRVAALKDAKGFVESLPDQEGCGHGGGNGVEVPEESDALRIAGIFVVGVAKGTLLAIIPIFAMSVSVAFMRKMTRTGAEVGG